MIAGSLLVLFTLADTFFTVLNYNDRGLFFNRAIRGAWTIEHFLFKPLRYRSRRATYRALTGVNLVLGIGLWVFGIVFGFSLLYYGAGQLHLLQSSGGSSPGFSDSIYYSIAQFSTVGGAGYTPAAPWLGILTVIETLLSVVLLSMVITYLVNIFSSIEALRTYCACFPNSAAEVTSPLGDVATYLPNTNSFSLEAHLITIRESMNGYFDSIAADHTAIYFYSGKDRFVMPFPVFMTAGVIEALQYGAKGRQGIGRVPELDRLEDAFSGNRDQIYQLFRWEKPPAPEPLKAADFAAVATEMLSGEVLSGGAKSSHPDTVATTYVHRFVNLRTGVAALLGESASTDWPSEYSNYVDWLKFAGMVDDFIRRSSTLFDYRPQFDGKPFELTPPLELYGWSEA